MLGYIKNIILSRMLRLPLRLALSAFLNGVYIFFNLYFSFIYKDLLLLFISVYYFILALMRLILLRRHRSDKACGLSERDAVAIGTLLLCLSVTMSLAVALTLSLGKAKHYEPYSVIPQAAFFVFCLFGLVLRTARHGLARDSFLGAADLVSASATLFSLFNLFNYFSHAALFGVSRSAALAVGVGASLGSFLCAILLISRRGR